MIPSLLMKFQAIKLYKHNYSFFFRKQAQLLKQQAAPINITTEVTVEGEHHRSTVLLLR